MATTTHHSATALTYARALLELAQASGQHEAVGEQLAGITDALDADPTFKAFMADPSISADERGRVIDKALKPQVEPVVANFLHVVNGHGRSALLGEIAGAYQFLLDQVNGKVEVDVTVAHELSETQLEEVRDRVSKALNKNAVVRQKVDDSIIGGLVLKVGDKLIDASVRSQLQGLKRQLLERRPR
ncbi:MAG: ATP synthase F1 subunit delta [Phycisphaerae bacterium]|nr:ATP synthase F1 subunit delta [Tepidisphaeraceae bacterium]